METGGSTINDLLNKYDYLFDILGTQSECRKLNTNEQEKAEFNVQSLELDKFSLFPNPTNHSIRLHFQSKPGQVDIFINNTLGELVYHERIPEFEGWYNKLIDLSHNSNGVLVMSIAQDGKIFAEQIIFNSN